MLKKQMIGIVVDTLLLILAIVSAYYVKVLFMP